MDESRSAVLREQWSLPADVTYLHHGAFGPSPRVVVAARAEWTARLEAEPMDFLIRRFAGELDRVAEVLGRFVGARPENLALVDNATFAMNAVAASLPLDAGDEILLTDHEYGAVLRTWQRHGEPFGARVVVAPLPYPVGDDGSVVEAILSRVTPRTRLIVVSHVTSPTAVELPVAAICARARERGVPVCIDGPHAVAMVPLDVESLGCDFYCASGHKWLCGPFGSGFLYAAPRWHERMRSAVVSWGHSPPGRGRRWQDEFAYLGTRDSAAHLALPTAIRFLEEIGLDEFRAHGRGLVERAIEALDPLAPNGQVFRGNRSRLGTMVSLALPPIGEGAVPTSDGDPWQTALWEEHRIEVPIVHWAARRFVRPSFHVYNDARDLDRLVGAITSLAAR